MPAFVRPTEFQDPWYPVIEQYLDDVESTLNAHGIDITDANNAALDATTIANLANTTANGKNRVYRQAAMPTGGTYVAGDQWFDTDDGNKVYIWDGTAWVSAQDAVITEALNTALDAQTSADGKNKTFSQPTAPTATAINDVWIDTTNFVVKTWNGTTWVAATFGTQAIAAGAITTAKLSAGAVTANEIAAGAITAAKIAANAVTATAIAAGTITATSAIVSSLDAGKITVGTLNAALINVINLNATAITGNGMLLNSTGTYAIRVNHASASTTSEFLAVDSTTGLSTFYSQRGNVFGARSVTTGYGLVGNDNPGGAANTFANNAYPTLTIRGWNDINSKDILSVQTYDQVVRFSVPRRGGAVVGNGGILSQSATAGFFSVPVVTGPPTGTPDTDYRPTGAVPIVFGTDNKMYAYSGGAWKSVTFA